MKIASWNVNSLKVRLPQLLDWLAQAAPDVVCLQETKLEDANFPITELAAAGYQTAFVGQKTYNGVALLARHSLHEVCDTNPLFPDPQKRLIAATINGLRVVCVYVPNGQEVDSEKYHYKLAWLNALQEWLAGELTRYPQLLLAGDFNIAPADADVHNPAQWQGKILCSDTERSAFCGLLSLGLNDSFRLFPQPEKSYSWWDYRAFGFQRNHGLRIDHILVSSSLTERCINATIERAIRKNERPSDHAPVTLELRD